MSFQLTLKISNSFSWLKYFLVLISTLNFQVDRLTFLLREVCRTYRMETLFMCYDSNTLIEGLESTWSKFKVSYYIKYSFITWEMIHFERQDSWDLLDRDSNKSLSKSPPTLQTRTGSSCPPKDIRPYSLTPTYHHGPPVKPISFTQLVYVSLFSWRIT